MELKKLKHIPIYDFFLKLTKINKALFVVAMLALICVGVFTLMAAHDPSAWSVGVTEVTNSQPAEVLLQKVEENYRSIDLVMNAYQQSVSYVASPITPSSTLVYIFILGQILGWTLFLTSATYIKRFWAFPLFFMFAVAFFLSNYGGLIYPERANVLNGGFVLLTIIPAFLFQQSYIRARLWLRAIIFLVLIAGPIWLAHGESGWVGLQSMIPNMYVVITIISLIFLFFIGKEWINLLFFVATNAKDRTRRLGFPVILGIFLVMVALQFLMLQNVMGWNWIPLEGFPLRPIHLIVIAAIFSPILSQNAHLPMRSSIPNSAFTLGIPALGLIMLSMVGYLSSSGEILYLRMVERLGILIMFVNTALYFGYVILNFYEFVRARSNYYFLMMIPKRTMYFVVVFLTLLVSLGIEASQGKRGLQIFRSAMFNQLADHEMLSGNGSEALFYYKWSIGAAPGTVKGNYNAAQLEFTEHNDIDASLEYYKEAVAADPFPYASLNRGNIYRILKENGMAKTIYTKQMSRRVNAEVANNLALVWLELNQPDSAIHNLKIALQEEPDRSGLYANLGSVYLRYDRMELAKKFFEAGLKAKEPGSAAATSAMYMNLAHGEHMEVPEHWWSHTAVAMEEAPRFNLALDHFRKQRFGECQVLVDSILSGQETPDALLLDGMLKFERGELDLAISRMVYIESVFPDYAPVANHFLGAMYLRNNVPEMAAEYFRKSVASGWPRDLLLEGQMELDAGNQEYAYAVLSRARVEDESLWSAVSKEIALLLASRGQYNEAYTEWDFENITTEERIRISRNAGAIRNYPEMLENFRRILEEDSTTVEPFIEIARIYRENRDTSWNKNIIEDLKYAQGKSEDKRLTQELTLAYLIDGQHNKAEKTFHAKGLQEESDYFSRFIFAQLQIAKGDTTKGKNLLLELRSEQPLNFSTNILLAKLFLAQKEYAEGHELMYPLVTQLNYRNSDYWYYQACFDKGISRDDDAGNSAIKAMALTLDESRKSEIAREFAEQIRIAKENNPAL